MSPADWRPPDVNSTGFVSLYKLTKRAKKLERDAFVRSFPVAGLLVHYEGETLETTEKPDSAVQLLTVSMQASGVLRYLNKIAFLCKRAGNPYAHLVSVGRSSTNDLVIAIDSVSKVHGYFVNEKGGWSFVDRNSTNGSQLNGKTLENGVHTPMRDGDKLKLGLDVTLELLEPASLHQRLSRFS
jgi:hypothetical protein